MQIVPILDLAYLKRMGFTETTREESDWCKELRQGILFVDSKTGRGRLKRGPDDRLDLHFQTVTQIKWFLDCLI